MKLSDWIIFADGMTRYEIKSVFEKHKNYIPKDILEINFSNYKSNNQYSDEFCWFQVILNKGETNENIYIFDNLFQSVLLCDKWAIQNGYQINNPLFIPNIGKPYSPSSKVYYCY